MGDGAYPVAYGIVALSSGIATLLSYLAPENIGTLQVMFLSLGGAIAISLLISSNRRNNKHP